MLLYWKVCSISYVSIFMTTILIVLTETKSFPFTTNTSAIVPVSPVAKLSSLSGIIISVFSPVTRSILNKWMLVPNPA
ncbi:Uncharacterised protein [Chlamydia abortus]|nr:Uncharacterised protein [Chlamydia abortus]